MERPNLNQENNSESGHIEYNPILGLAIIALIVFASYTAVEVSKLNGELQELKEDIQSTPTSTIDINSFENSFNSELQLTQTPQP